MTLYVICCFGHIDDWRKLCTGELEEQQSRHLFTKIQKDTMLTACEIERQLGDKD